MADGEGKMGATEPRKKNRKGTRIPGSTCARQMVSTAYKGPRGGHSELQAEEGDSAVERVPSSVVQLHHWSCSRRVTVQDLFFTNHGLNKPFVSDILQAAGPTKSACMAAICRYSVDNRQRGALPALGLGQPQQMMTARDRREQRRAAESTKTAGSPAIPETTRWTTSKEAAQKQLQKTQRTARPPAHRAGLEESRRKTSDWHASRVWPLAEH